MSKIKHKSALTIARERARHGAEQHFANSVGPDELLGAVAVRFAIVDAYMIRANDALKADDKAAKSAGTPSPTRTPSWATDTPTSWSK